MAPQLQPPSSYVILLPGILALHTQKPSSSHFSSFASSAASRCLVLITEPHQLHTFVQNGRTALDVAQQNNHFSAVSLRLQTEVQLDAREDNDVCALSSPSLPTLHPL
eukprot:scaffold107306_cov30-Tisochrysis_lutea.AAC.8